MIIHQTMPPIDPEDGLYLVTLRSNSIIFPWDKSAQGITELSIRANLDYNMLSSGGVLSRPEKIDDIQYELYLSRPAMRKHGMVMFYYWFPAPVMYPIPNHIGHAVDTPITGWHVLMSDVAQHTKINKT
jgi:hypothetical protein